MQTDEASEVNSRRFVRVGMSSNWFQDGITQGAALGPTKGYQRCTKGLPPGAKIVGSYVDSCTMSGYWIFEHESFDAVPEAMPIPELVIEFHWYENEAAETLNQ